MAWLTSPAQVVEPEQQNVNFKVQLHSAYMSSFTVREASDNNVQPFGIRVMASDYDRLPWEIGFHAYGKYGEVASFSYGISFAYLIEIGSSNIFKAGLGLSKIELEDVDANEDEFGPHVGDVNFDDFNQEFRPYIEWELKFSGFSSLFFQSGYRIISGGKNVTTDIQRDDSGTRRIKRDFTFFYAASGIDFGVGLSINF